MTTATKFFLLFFAGMILFVTSGCAVDNEFLAKMPLFEAKSDKIPGLEPPLQRKKLIRLKGQKGATVSDTEKEILVAQLMFEYRTSPDPNMRRESVDAMAKIPHPKGLQYLKEILTDSDPFVRLSALEALGKNNYFRTEEGASFLIEFSKQDPDKDLRVASIRILGDCYSEKKTKSTVYKSVTLDKGIFEKLRERVILVLGEALYDKVPAVRYEAMQSLHKVTGKDYGNDINRWIQYVQYQKGESLETPKERSFTEKLPAVQLPMFK